MRIKLQNLFLVIVTILLSSSFQRNFSDPINALTTLEAFNPYIVEYKLRLVVPISTEQIYGEWEVIASFFSVTDKEGVKSKTILGTDGNRYDFQQNEQVNINIYHEGKHHKTIKTNWKFNSDKTGVQCGDGDLYNIRVHQDTMEWIYEFEVKDLDNDYYYIVLVKNDE